MSDAEEAAFAPIGAWRDFTAYRGALILPIDPEGRVLLQLRDRRAPVHPGEWGLFGGEVEAGETLREAALRELEEEIGVQAPANALRPFARLVSPTSRGRLYLFEAELDIGPADVRLREGAGFGFVERRDFARLDLLAATRVFLAAWTQARAA